MVEKNQILSVIDEYILQFTPDIQEKLQALQTVIKKVAPAATEKFSYQMPTFYLYGNLVHFAVQKNHIGFYPAPSGITNFKELLKEYKTSKGAVQFPIDQPLPLETIRKIVQFRVEENTQKHLTKQKKSK